ncbi:hypothetical protein [Flammeovirga sp. SJP92]|uniref:hypothetical protein n=1 Tax=Flammeovirga sp. SJP92 TaxID=1775430 RepID=UPI00078940AD|nr:hypothetical protein [Flammeovirga sp. SJP92]KXX71233.1 hypothetical protein AVL50_09255 [Flammeovirga sp. SJP92]
MTNKLILTITCVFLSLITCFGQEKIYKSLEITGTNDTRSVNGFNNAIQFTHPDHAALVFKSRTVNELMFGFHLNGNFYWGTGQFASKPNFYSMILDGYTGDLELKGTLNSNKIETNDLKLGSTLHMSGVGDGKFTTHFSDNGLFNFHYSRWRGGWKWTTDGSEDGNGVVRTIMSLHNHYASGTSVSFSLGTGVSSINNIYNVPDNSIVKYYIPRWRGGWKWATKDTNNQEVIGMQLKNDISGSLLQVDGRIISKEIKVKTDVWADYVFEDDYNLKSLSEVEAHIKEYKHLPDVPSAKEVEENGVNVGETEAMLLRKIEELTLYTIEQQKLIEEQNRKINKLEVLQQEFDEIKKLIKENK